MAPPYGRRSGAVLNARSSKVYESRPQLQEPDGDGNQKKCTSVGDDDDKDTGASAHKKSG